MLILFLLVSSALNRNILEGMYLQLFEIGLDQNLVFTPPSPSNLLLPFHDDRKASRAWRTPSQLSPFKWEFSE